MRVVRLTDLFERVKMIDLSATASETMISGVTQHSALVEPRWLFCCRRGVTGDGHRHAAEAVRRGATALLVEQSLRLPVAQVVVRDVAGALGHVATSYWGHPSRHLEVVGVTGTNGKTTTTFLLRTILELHGWPTGVIGTLSGPLTTPEPTDLQRTLADFVARGHRAAAMEVTSHALVQHRVDGTRFAVAVFTNLDRDHLDYHGDLETYFNAKSSLFTPGRAGLGVVNGDDPWGARLLARSRVPTVPYSLDDITALQPDTRGTRFSWRGAIIHLPLPGLFNVYNALAAATAAGCLGVDPPTIADALSTATAPPGRMEEIDIGQPFRLLVDCAHTPSALQQVLQTLRKSSSGRLIVVFGCGGDRDRSKRPHMGSLVDTYADLVILTADNPRTEPLDRIFTDVLSDVTPNAFLVEPDRRNAIDAAVELASEGDTVLIAGKGDQSVQQIGHLGIPFDDRQVARDALLSHWRPAAIG
jgi:UDP-N-acetylmuramoyl-L-alanyl-D-glutamate--2,6-diaminopimelate ligase